MFSLDALCTFELMLNKRLKVNGVCHGSKNHVYIYMTELPVSFNCAVNVELFNSNYVANQKSCVFSSAITHKSKINTSCNRSYLTKLDSNLNFNLCLVCFMCVCVLSLFPVVLNCKTRRFLRSLYVITCA